MEGLGRARGGWVFSEGPAAAIRMRIAKKSCRIRVPSFEFNDGEDEQPSFPVTSPEDTKGSSQIGARPSLREQQLNDGEFETAYVGYRANGTLMPRRPYFGPPALRRVPYFGSLGALTLGAPSSLWLACFCHLARSLRLRLSRRAARSLNHVFAEPLFWLLFKPIHRRPGQIGDGRPAVLLDLGKICKFNYTHVNAQILAVLDSGVRLYRMKGELDVGAFHDRGHEPEHVLHMGLSVSTSAHRSSRPRPETTGRTCGAKSWGCPSRLDGWASTTPSTS
jgi:hypothetical protein